MKKYKFIAERGALNEVTLTGAAQQRAHTPAPLPGDALLGNMLPQQAIEQLPAHVALEHNVIPVTSDGETITVAAEDPDDIALADKLRFLLNRNIRLVAASPQAIQDRLQEEYGKDVVFSGLSAMLGADMDASEPAPEEYSRRNMRAGLLPKKGLRADTYEQKKETTITGAVATDETPWVGGSTMFYFVVEEGQQALKRASDGSMEVVVGPKKVWKGRNRLIPMKHYVAHPGEFLIVRYRDGRQEHHAGPADIWFDPRTHKEITRQEALQLAAKEAVVVYSQAEGSTEITRRIVYGPGLFMPAPGEWLHTFSWHASRGGHLGVDKVPNGLVFQKLWLMPDQMYHDVKDVRTADDAVLTIRLMLFFELMDIEKMLDTTHDPIGDFVNAATSDVVDWVGRHDFEAFKADTARLNELEAYSQLTGRASQCGYRISKVVYRGYGAADSLQQMHDQAIEARTRLQLERATEQQAQDLENYKLECQIGRSTMRRTEQGAEVTHDMELAQQRLEVSLRQREEVQSQAREQRKAEAEMQAELRRQQYEQQQKHLDVLKSMGVDLTAYLTQARADQVIELRGGAGSRPHVHLEQDQRNGAK